MACCPPGAKPFLKEDPNYAPKGQMITYDGVRAYHVGNGRIGFLFLHDIFGLESGLNKLICDTISANDPNLTVIAPDLFPLGNFLRDQDSDFRGTSVVLGKVLWGAITCRMWGFLSKYSWENLTASIFNKSTTHLLGPLNCEKIILCGICWGTYFAFKGCALGQHKSQFIGNISIHPSVSMLAGQYGDDWKAMVNAVEVPQMIVGTKGENADWKPNGEVEKLLSSKSFAALCKYYATPEDHGFFTRGDTKNQSTSEAIGETLTNINSFVQSLQPRHDSK